MTKNKFFLGMLAIALTFGMMALGCDTGGGGDTGITYTVVAPGGPTQPGSNIELRGQVWTHVGFSNYTEFTGNRDIEGFILGSSPNFDPMLAGTGAITNGQLSFRMGTPSLLLPVADIIAVFAPGAVATPADARGNLLFLNTAGGETLTKENPIAFTSGVSSIRDFIGFFYASQSGNFSHPGGFSSQYFPASGRTVNVTMEPFSINMQAGWNILREHERRYFTSLTVHDVIVSFSLGNPANAKWMLDR